MKNTKLYIILVITIVLAIGILPFISTFNGFAISKSITDWGSFGSYLSGIFGVLNIMVFIYITYLISNLDDKRNKNQIEAQNKIVLCQFRQNELDKLSQILDSVFDNTGNEEKLLIIYKIRSASIYLNTFINQKKYLFPIIGDKKVSCIIENIESRYDQLILIIEELYGNKNIESWKEEKLMTKVQFVHLQKVELVDELQQFILKDLNN